MKGFVKKIDHIALVVDDIEEALEFWHDALGLDLSHVEDVPSENSMVAFLPAQESEVELVKPTNEDSGIARFLKSRGPGMHHICFEVYDIEETMAHLKSKGVRLINQSLPLSIPIALMECWLSFTSSRAMNRPFASIVPAF